jgi:hypothetical protein
MFFLIKEEEKRATKVNLVPFPHRKTLEVYFVHSRTREWVILFREQRIVSLCCPITDFFGIASNLYYNREGKNLGCVSTTTGAWKEAQEVAGVWKAGASERN